MIDYVGQQQYNKYNKSLFASGGIGEMDKQRQKDMKKELSETAKKADKDLNIILISMAIPLVLFIVFGNAIMEFCKDKSVNIWARFIPLMLIQFGLAGFGCVIIMLYRKEHFRDYGLIKPRFLQTAVMSAVVCIPAFIFMLVNNEVDSYLPLQGCLHTREFLSCTFPVNALGYALTTLVWGFFEGFNYVVISQKINDRYPGGSKYINYGAIACGIICILIHGMIGIDLYTLFEALTTFILIYGMLMIKEKTGNAWGCILIFIFFWNAI